MANFDAHAWLVEVAELGPRIGGDVLGLLLWRFPEWARGFREWRALVERPTPGALFELSRSASRAEVFPCARVFVSHKREDESLARCLAWIANQHGFEIWLDVLDPGLGAIAKQAGLPEDMKAILTAGIIEMGLLNSTHVLAVITKKARDSRWVPYEYGRVKEDDARTTRAACWLDDAVPRRTLPEYFHLGSILEQRPELEGWLQSEQTAWEYERRRREAAVPDFPGFEVGTSRACRPEPLSRLPGRVAPCI